MTGSEAYARPLRTVAVLIAASAITWELPALIRGSAEGSMLLVRGLEAAVAAVIAWYASPKRPLVMMRSLVLALALTVVLANLAVLLLRPTMVWSVSLIVTAVILASALFAPWSWRWQSALASVVWLVAVLAFMALPAEVFPSQRAVPQAAFALFVAALVSIAGAHLKDLERTRLAASEARYRVLFQEAEDALVVLDTGGRIRDGNPRIVELTGHSMDRLTGRHLGEILAIEPVPGESVQSLADCLVEKDTEPALVPAGLRTADGSLIEVEAAFSHVDTPEGPVVQASIRDLTERRALAERQAQLQRIEAIGRLAAGLAHQFNNLLGGILNQATLLRKEVGQPTQKAQLDAIAHAARRGEQLTKSLLRFTPHQQVAPRPTAPSAILDSVATLARLEDQRVRIEVSAGKPPAVAADPDHLTHALLELVFNARNAVGGQADPVITLAAAEEQVVEGDVRWVEAGPGRYVRFSVIDRGAGMDDQTRARLFEPFFSTRPMYEAAGLGLATVFWVVRAHRGSMAIDSAPGKGTAIHLLIPAADTPAVVDTTPTLWDAGVRRVLVADDEELIRNTTRRALQQFGYEVQVAADGDEAWQELTGGRSSFDVAILDVVMPGGGVDLVRRLREDLPSLRILVSSGYGPGGEVQRMLEAGASGFLQKPYELGELRSAVEALLGSG